MPPPSKEHHEDTKEKKRQAEHRAANDHHEWRQTVQASRPRIDLPQNRPQSIPERDVR